MRKALNMILTALSAAILMVWVWKFFGPGSEETRRAGSAALGGNRFELRRAAVDFHLRRLPRLPSVALYELVLLAQILPRRSARRRGIKNARL